MSPTIVVPFSMMTPTLAEPSLFPPSLRRYRKISPTIRPFNTGRPRGKNQLETLAPGISATAPNKGKKRAAAKLNLLARVWIRTSRLRRWPAMGFRRQLPVHRVRKGIRKLLRLCRSRPLPRAQLFQLRNRFCGVIDVLRRFPADHERRDVRDDRHGLRDGDRAPHALGLVQFSECLRRR
jgi:hypothetical protein